MSTETLQRRIGQAIHNATCNCLDRGFGYTLRSRDLDVMATAVLAELGQGTWERIARRRAQLLAAGGWDLAVQRSWVKSLVDALETRNAEYDRLVRGLEATFGVGNLASFLAELEADGSGRDYPQAWKGPKGQIYRDNDGTIEFWGPSIYSRAGIEGWAECGECFRSIDYINQSVYGPLKKVPSPDCSNCDSRGCMDCVMGHTGHGVCQHNCPACCGS